MNKIANLEKKIPKEMIGSDNMSVTKEFIDYALPLILGEPELVYDNGVVALETLLDIRASLKTYCHCLIALGF